MVGKIRSYRLKKNREKINLQVPVHWIRDMHLKEGDSIDLYRDEEDRLVLIANRKEPAGVS